MRLSDLRKPKAAASGLTRSVDVRTRVRIPGTLSADWTTPTPMNAVDAVHVTAVEGPGATMARVQCAASEADRLAAGSLLREQASPPAEYQAEGFAGRERYRVSSRVLGNGSYGVVWCACAMCSYSSPAAKDRNVVACTTMPLPVLILVRLGWHAGRPPSPRHVLRSLELWPSSVSRLCLTTPVVRTFTFTL